jgi:hypothetical protein
LVKRYLDGMLMHRISGGSLLLSDGIVQLGQCRKVITFCVPVFLCDVMRQDHFAKTGSGQTSGTFENYECAAQDKRSRRVHCVASMHGPSSLLSF